MLSARKLMAAIFWDRKGVLVVEFMQQGATITSQAIAKHYKKLHRAIQKKRRGMLTYGVVFLNDNAHPHTAACT
jgi:hypothetical protein